MEANDVCRLIIPKYAKLSKQTIKYLIDEDLVSKSQFKNDTVSGFDKFMPMGELNSLSIESEIV